MTHIIHINNSNYTSYDVIDALTFNKTDIIIDPIENKLFTNDVFNVADDNKITVVHSSIRNDTSIPGVLILTGNKTYGREKKTIKSKHTFGRLFYKCVPDDIRLPHFLVPYEIKKSDFSKIIKNMYVTICFDQWDEKTPKGKLENVIGNVDILDNFYEYQLYCKSINKSIQQFQKATHASIQNISNQENKPSHDHIIDLLLLKYPQTTDRTNRHIITIDPLNSQDYDDGVGVIELPDGVQQLSIYISNVTLLMDVLHLWSSFSKRIATIYLPDKKRPMLPSILSDCLCSLQQNVRRVAFVMDVFIKNDTIIDVVFSNSIICVKKNYVYEEEKLLNDQTYLLVLKTVQQISKKYKYVANVRNSHELVCYLMILMNYNCATQLIQKKTGIFRSTIAKKPVIVPDTLPEDVCKFIKIWNSVAGQYINGSEIVDTRHELLAMDAYIHITSPIRRLVDLLNMIQFQKTFEMNILTEDAGHFYETWLNELEYINTTMRSIRKIQCDCSLLDLCFNNPKVLEAEYDGYVFDMINRNDGLYQYVVFLPELKLSSRITSREKFENFTHKKCSLYLFNNEAKCKKKIRLQLLS